MDATTIRQLCDRVHDIDRAVETGPSARQLESGRATTVPLIINTRLMTARDDLKATLVSWALLIVEEGATDYTGEDTLLGVSAWIYQHAEFLADHPAAGDFVSEVTECLAAVVKCVEHRDRRMIVGTFNGENIYAGVDDATVTLPNGEVHRVETLRNQLKRHALRAQGTAAEVSQILEHLHGVSVSAKSIVAMWREDRRARERGRLGRLEGLDIVTDDPPIFVVDEVLARIGRRPQAQSLE
jgi:hypothetical protein